MHNGNELKGFQRLQEYISKKSKITNALILSGQKAAAEYLQEAMRGRSAPRGRSSPHMLDTFMFEQDETTAETKTTLMKLCSLIDDESESEVR